MSDTPSNPPDEMVDRDNAIRIYADRGMAPKDIGAKFDLSAQQVSAILRRKTNSG